MRLLQAKESGLLIYAPMTLVLGYPYVGFGYAYLTCLTRVRVLECEVVPLSQEQVSNIPLKYRCFA